MSEKIGTFEFAHVANTYTADDNNRIMNYSSWRGAAEGYGTVYGTLAFGPIALGDMNEKLQGGPIKWVGQGFLEDGTSVGGVGTGTWKKDPNGHAWHTEMIVEISDGSRIKSVGQIALATLMFTGTTYSM